MTPLYTSQLLATSVLLYRDVQKLSLIVKRLNIVTILLSSLYLLFLNFSKIHNKRLNIVSGTNHSRGLMGLFNNYNFHCAFRNMIRNKACINQNMIYFIALTDLCNILLKLISTCPKIGNYRVY